MIKLFVTGGHGNVRTGMRELSREEIAAAVDAAHARGARVRAHCAWKREILECVELGVDVIDHGDFLDAECIDAMAEAGTFLDPSALYLEKLLAHEPLRREPGFAAARAEAERELASLQRWLPEANAAGVRIVLGDDYGTILLPHGTYGEEFEFYVKRMGFAPQDVLRWATRHGAALAGLEAELGTLAAGKLADLVVVDGDPLTKISDLRRTRYTIKDGVVYALDDLLRAPRR
jgi:imidazolonepropionase-like amidohydrolase